MPSTTIPTMTTVADAHEQLRSLAQDHDWVSVYWDRGWGEDLGRGAEISIIVDGNGQQPQASLTAEVYESLLQQQVIRPDSLKTYKARRLHDYSAPASKPSEGPAPIDLAEQVVRDILAASPDQPLHASFYRGLDPNSKQPLVRYEQLATSAHPDGRFVLILPGASDAAISAQEPGILGHDIIGNHVAAVVRYPRTVDGSVDADGLRNALQSEIDTALARIEQARAHD